MYKPQSIGTGGLTFLSTTQALKALLSQSINILLKYLIKLSRSMLRGVWLELKYVIPEMRRRGDGSIVISSSAVGIKWAVDLSAYVASKHAVVSLMRAAALECAAMGIRVNAVNSAPIETRMMRSLEEALAPSIPDQAKESFADSIPMKRYGTPEEVAQLMLFLASDESGCCTGGVYMVDGGRSAT